MELIYTCISKLAVSVNQVNDSALPDDLKHYTDPNDFNRMIYHQRSTDADTGAGAGGGTGRDRKQASGKLGGRSQNRNLKGIFSYVGSIESECKI